MKDLNKQLRITCVSDLHGYLPKVPGGDILLVAGDLTAQNMQWEYAAFLSWIKTTPYRCKVVVAGNHDGLIERGEFSLHCPEENIYYLCDSGIIFEGLNIWGSPYTPTFLDWHFMRDRGAPIKKHWDLIPTNTDILVTHGPPHGILDQNSDGRHVGCEELRKVVEERVKPLIHCFGHIHECAAGKLVVGPTTYLNCSFVDVHYRPINPPIHLEV